MRAIACILILWASTALAQNKTIGTAKLPIGTEKRAAVIFANQDYDDPRYDLQKTHNDADDMAKVLGSMGFEVFPVKKDLNRVDFYREINQLREKLKGYQMVFFYYSGHGAEYEGQNYLIPTDIKLEYDSDIKANGVEMALVYKVLRQAQVKTSIVALDACRSLPIGKGEVATGLNIPRNNPAGTFTMYATEAGRVARENRSPNGRNSFFTQELLKHLPIPNLTINEIHYNTRNAVGDATNQEQLPDVADKLGGKLYLLTKEVIDPEKEAMRAEIERLKAEREAALKNTATPADNTRVTPLSVIPTQDRAVAQRSKPTPTDLPFIDMAFIKGGTFKMGSTDGSGDEKPVHNVTVSSFYMGKYEVTVEQFAAFVTATNYQTDAEKGDGSYAYINGSWQKKAGINWRHDEEGNERPTSQHTYPVVHVSHNDAVAFCDWLSKKEGKTYRLPTEAQWEYAAGGSSHTKYSWGNSETSGVSGNVADETAKKKYSSWTTLSGYTDGYVYAAPVGKFAANTFGLYDMSGNVWEWCSDWYADNWYAQPAAGKPNPENQTHGSKTDRVLRGGSWTDSPYGARVAFRFNFRPPDFRSYLVGFRVVSPSQ
jgi:formylglycine-generating enzyme required for sulfatase activity